MTSLKSGGVPPVERFIKGAYVDDGDGNRHLFAPYVLSEEHLQFLKERTEPKMFAAWYLNEARAEGEDIFSPSYIQYIDGEMVGGPFGSSISIRAHPLGRAWLRSQD